MDDKYEVNQKRKLISDVVAKNDLISMFKRMRIIKGMILYVQSDLETFSYVNGGCQTLVEALQEVVGFEGSIVTPSFSENLVDPACDMDYLFERDVFDEIRASKPAFHKKKTRSECGDFSNQLMRNDGVFRSNHPTHSFVAWGKYAKLICDSHPLHFSLGKESPLDKVVEMNGYVLLLGTSYRYCDIFKYASCITQKNPIRVITSPIEKKERRIFIKMLEMDYELKNIHVIQQMMEERNVVNDGYVGNAHCRFFKAKEASVLAQGYFNSFE